MAAQLVTGRHDLVADYAAATSLGMEIARQGPVGDALELLVPDYRQYETLADGSDALDFLRRCLAVKSEDRLSIAELRHHPFMAYVE